MKRPFFFFPAIAAFILMFSSSYAQQSSERIAYTFEPLPYAYDALEPSIDARTMEIHYDRHHRAYYNNFVKAIKDTDFDGMTLEAIFARMSVLPMAVRNNGGGYFNHTFFWNSMSANGGGAPKGKIADAIKSTFGSFEEFQKQFEQAGATRFGSGWAWLSVDAKGNLFISSTPNQDNPLMDVVDQRGVPILGLDVWEHAYYLKYQNQRGSYMTAFWNVVNWAEIVKRYETLIK